MTVSFFLQDVAGSGQETDIFFNEDRCRSKIPVTVMGRDFVGESQNAGGVVSRSADLSGVGDHLIEFQSDARLDFLLKIDVLPVRLKNTDMTNGSM